MMFVKLRVGLLIASVVHAIGDVVAVPDRRGHELVKEGAADHHDGEGVEVKNPGYNRLADSITPPPDDADLDEWADSQRLEPQAPRVKTRQGRGRVAETATVEIPQTEG